MKPRNFTPFRSHTSIAIAFSVALVTHFATVSAFAVTYYWDNDGTTAGFGTAAGTWAAPTTGNTTQGWSQDSAGTTEPVNVTTTTDDDVLFGTTVSLASGTVTVSGTVNVKSVTFGSASGPITLSGGTIALGGTSPFMRFNNTNDTISSALTLEANTSILMGNSAALQLNLNGSIGGTGNLTFSTPNISFSNANQVITLGAASAYSGNTLITTGNQNNRLRVNSTVANALPSTSVLTLDGGNGAGSGRTLIFDLNGNNQTVAGLASVVRTLRDQQVLNTGAATTTLTINNPNNPTWRANIAGAGIGVVKQGIGTQTFTGANGYNGPTSITAGKLVGVVGGHCRNSEVRLDDAAATAGVSVTDNTLSWKWGGLTANAPGTLEFDFGAITPSTSVSPLLITNESTGTGVADFTAATPKVQINVNTGLLPGTYPLITWDTVSGTIPTTADLTVSNVAAGTAASLEVVSNTLNLVITSTAVSIVKANNTDNLNLGTSWVGGVVPATTEFAKWNNTVTAANTTNLGADTTWAGIAIENPNGLVTINGTNTLTLGAAVIDIDLSTADTADLTLNCPLALGDANIWDVAATRTVTLGGQVSGAFGITKLGDGTAVLSSTANNYTGNTTVTAGTLQLGASNVIPNTAGFGNVSVTGTLDLNGNSETVNGLSGAGTIDNTGAATSTFVVGTNGATSTFNGVIQDTVGTLAFTKTGTGMLTLGGANTFAGATAVAGGTLILGNASALGGTSGISLAGGTTLSASLSGITVNQPITLGATGTSATITAPNVAGSGTSAFPVTISGAIGGAGNLILSGVSTTNAYGNINLNAASNYAGSTLITTVAANNNANIFVNLGVANALPVTTVVTLDGGDGTGGGRFTELDLNGQNQTLAGLTNITGLSLRTQRVTSTAAATLTINDSESLRTYSGQINGAISLVKSNVGTWTLSGAKAYTGTTTITGGTLALGSSNVLPTTTVSIGGGTLSIGPAFTDTVGALALTSAATISLGDNTSALVFADSSLEIWSGPLKLNGTFVSGASLRFGTTNAGLSAAQIASISASGFTDFALDADGFLTATSTGGFSSWITGTFANGTVPGDKQGPNDDFDNDGISNLVEYAIAGQDPTVSNASVGTFAANVLSFAKRTDATGLTYAIQESTDLGIGDDWTEVAGGSYVNDATTISYTLTPGSPAKNFTRLKVTAN